MDPLCRRMIVYKHLAHSFRALMCSLSEPHPWGFPSRCLIGLRLRNCGCTSSQPRSSTLDEGPARFHGLGSQKRVHQGRRCGFNWVSHRKKEMWRASELDGFAYVVLSSSIFLLNILIHIANIVCTPNHFTLVLYFRHKEARFGCLVGTACVPPRLEVWACVARSPSPEHSTPRTALSRPAVGGGSTWSPGLCTTSTEPGGLTSCVVKGKEIALPDPCSTPEKRSKERKLKTSADGLK